MTRKWRLYDNSFQVSRLPESLKEEYNKHKSNWSDHWLNASAMPLDNLTEDKWSEPLFLFKYKNYAEYNSRTREYTCHVFTAELYQYDNYGLPIAVLKIVTAEDRKA